MQWIALLAGVAGTVSSVSALPRLVGRTDGNMTSSPFMNGTSTNETFANTNATSSAVDTAATSWLNDVAPSFSSTKLSSVSSTASTNGWDAWSSSSTTVSSASATASADGWDAWSYKYGSGSASGSPAVVSVSAPIATLTPAYHWDHDPSDLSHLQPSDICQLHFSEGANNAATTEGSQYVTAQTSFNYPTIVLDHSSYASITLNGNTMTISFSSSSAYQTAKQSWPSSGNWFVLVTATSSSDGSYTYFLTSSATFDDNSMSATSEGQQIDFDSAAEQFSLEWGTYHSASSSSYGTGSTPTSSGPGAYTPSGGANGTSPYSTTSNTTSASNSSTSSIPTAAPGASFDTSLDDTLGYIVWEESDFKTDLNNFAAGLDDYNWNDYNDQDDTNDDLDGLWDDNGDIKTVESSVVKRVPNKVLKPRASATTRARSTAVVADVRKDAATTSKKAATEKKTSLKDKVVNFVKSQKENLAAIKSWVDGTPHQYQVNNSFAIPNATQVKYVDQSYFLNADKSSRKAISIYSNDKKTFNVYCIDCGVTGTVKVAGTAAFHLAKGLQQGQVELVGGLSVGVNIGVAAGVAYGDKKEMRLTTQGIPGFSVPNMIVIGPMITVDAQFGWDFTATGQMLVGGTVEVVNARAVIDLVNPSNNVQPSWAPKFKPEFQAQGKIAVDAYVGLPIGLAVGIDIANSKFKADVAVVSTPTLHTGAQFAASAGLAGGKVVAGVNSAGCNGIAYYINIQHSLQAKATASLLGKSKSINRKLMDDFKLDLLSKCLSLGGKTRRDDSGAYGNSTDDAVSDDATDFDAMVQYTGGSDPFADILVDIDGNGINDNDEYVVPDEVADYLNDTESNFTVPLDPDNSITEGPEFNYTYVMDTSYSNTLVYSEDGNLHMQDSSALSYGDTLFEVYDDLVVGDSLGRTLFYYTPTIEKYNVSRIRLGDADHLPISSEIVNFAPIDYDDNSSNPAVYGAIDTLGNLFYPVLCSYADGTTASKLFLVADLDTGLDTLVSAELQDIVTGGVISECFGMPLTSGVGGI